MFRNHVYEIHSDSEPIISITAHIAEEVPEEVLSNEDEIHEPCDADKTSRMKAAAIWILKVQETYKLPQSTMEQLLKDVSGFFQDLLVDLLEDVFY